MPGILAALFSPAIVTAIVNALIDQGGDVFKAYINKAITKEELQTRLRTVLLNTIADVERAHADALAKTYTSFMGALAQSKLMQAVWAIVVLSQTGVLCAYQLGLVPPAQGIEWAYALLAGLCGLGPVVLRHGPGVLPMQSMRNAAK